MSEVGHVKERAHVRKRHAHSGTRTHTCKQAKRVHTQNEKFDYTHLTKSRLNVKGLNAANNSNMTGGQSMFKNLRETKLWTNVRTVMSPLIDETKAGDSNEAVSDKIATRIRRMMMNTAT